MPFDEGSGSGVPGGRGSGDNDPQADSAAGGAADAATLLEAGPTVLGLARLSRRAGLVPAEEEVYRRIAQLVDIGEDDEFLVAPCGRGLAAEFLAGATGAAGSGADPDSALVAAATERVQQRGLAVRLHFDPGPLTDLPYKDDIFDLVIGDVGLAASREPAAAVAELARVAKPLGAVVLVQPVWNRAVDEIRRDVLVEHLGARPQLLVEWKQMLRDAGVVDLFVEDLVDAANPWRSLLGGGAALDFPTLRERLHLLYSAWRQWGWYGLGQAVAGGQELRRLIMRERILGLALIKGTKWREQPAGDGRGPHDPAEAPGEARAGEAPEN